MAAAKTETAEAAPAPATGLGVYRAIVAITDAMGKGIAKDRENSDSGPKFKYRGIEDVLRTLNPLLALHNLAMLPRVVECASKRDDVGSSGKKMMFSSMRMELDLVSSEDGSRHTIAAQGFAMDSGDKSVNKAMSIAYKYATLLAFCIPTSAVDDQEAGEPDQQRNDPPPRQAEPPTQQSRGSSGSPPAGRGRSRQADAGDMKAKQDAEFKAAVELMNNAPDLDALKHVWEKRIRWDVIPKDWVRELEQHRNRNIAEIKAQPAADDRSSGGGAPGFEPVDDDIPF